MWDYWSRNSYFYSKEAKGYFYFFTLSFLFLFSYNLKETKFQVFIFAKDLPPNTTSNKAAAVWYPFLASPPDKVAKWASETLEYLKGETVHPNSGVIFRKTMELLKEENGMEEPYWKVCERCLFISYQHCLHLFVGLRFFIQKSSRELTPYLQVC